MISAAVLAASVCGSLSAAENAEGTAASGGEKTFYEGAISRASVHDPSIIREGDTYYVFGSHLAAAKSEDLVNWEQLCKDYENPTDNAIYGNLTENFAETFEWAGFNDGDCTGGYAIWAPDVH